MLTALSITRPSIYKRVEQAKCHKTLRLHTVGPFATPYVRTQPSPLRAATVPACTIWHGSASGTCRAHPPAQPIALSQLGSAKLRTGYL